MDKRDYLECLLFAGLRLIAIGLMLIGGFGLVFQIVESWYRFDPNYLGAFLLGSVFRPALIAVAGLILFKASASMARGMAARFTAD
jgi:hypothetical protein